MWIWWAGNSVSEEYGMPTLYANEKRGWHSHTHSTYVHGPVGCRCTGSRVTRGKDVTTWLQLLTFPTSLFSTTEREDDTVGTWPGLSTNGCLRRVPPPLPVHTMDCVPHLHPLNIRIILVHRVSAKFEEVDFRCAVCFTCFRNG